MYWNVFGEHWALDPCEMLAVSFMASSEEDEQEEGEGEGEGEEEEVVEEEYDVNPFPGMYTSWGFCGRDFGRLTDGIGSVCEILLFWA